MQLLIRRQGTLIDVSPDGHSPLPRDLVEVLKPHLRYDHKRLLRGNESYDPTSGLRHQIEITVRDLYRLEQGRLATGYGFIARITRILQSLGHQVAYLDMTAPREDPECYTPNWENLQRSTWRPRHQRQMDCLAAISNTQGGVINATMGFGKTEMFRALCHLYPRAKIAIVVAPKDVAANLTRRLTRDFPNVGQVGGGKKWMGERITVFTAKSCHYAKDYDWDLLLCDEAHQLMSDGASDMLGETFTTTRNFAFTATPSGRIDGAHAKLEMFFGPEIFRLLYPEAVELGLVVPIHVRWLKMDSQINPAANKSGVTKLRWGIWRHDRRHALIARDVRTMYTNNEQILIAVATLDHAIHLWRHLPEFELCYAAKDATELDGYKESKLLPANFTPMTQARRDALRTGFEEGTVRRVIATDVWSTGVDFEKLQVLYRADARETETLDSQWGGRPSRIYNGKASSEIVDIIDCFDPGLKRKSQARHRHYQAHGWSTDWPVALRQAGNV